MKCYKHSKKDAVGVCANCGKGVCEECSVEIKDKVFCKDCTKKGEVHKKEHVSGWWWLLPLFLSWIGGIIAWAVNKDRDPSKARSMLVFGFIITFFVVFLLIVAGILAGWATQFVTQSRSELQFCSRAQLLIQRAYYNSTTEELGLNIFNKGDVPLTGIRINITQKNGAIRTIDYEDIHIQYKDIGTLAIRTSGYFESVLVQSLQCRGAQDLIGRYDIQGMGFDY